MLWVQTIYDPERGGRFVQTEATAGSWLRDAIAEAVQLAQRLEMGVQFPFNGHLCWVRPDDDPEQRYAHFVRLWKLED